jgi:hypothetical protein
VAESQFFVSAAALLRSLSVDSSWQMELAASLARSKRSVLPGYLDRLTLDLLHGSSLAPVAVRDVARRRFARSVGLRPLLRLVAPYSQSSTSKYSGSAFTRCIPKSSRSSVFVTLRMKVLPFWIFSCTPLGSPAYSRAVLPA